MQTKIQDGPPQGTCHESEYAAIVNGYFIKDVEVKPLHSLNILSTKQVFSMVETLKKLSK